MGARDIDQLKAALVDAVQQGDATDMWNSDSAG